MRKQYVATCTLFFLLILILLLPSNAVSDDDSISISGSYGGEGTDIAFQGIQTFDDGYVLIGATNSYGSGGFDYWLIKTDQNGIVEWDKYYGDIGDDSASSIVQTADGGYALAGYSNSFHNNDFDFLLIKTNDTGEIQWYENYGGIYEDRCRWLVKTIDGGYALAGFSNSFDKDSYDFLLVKTDGVGDIQWYQSYGGFNTDKAEHLIQTEDGGFLLVGETNSFGAGNYDFWVVKTDCNGSMEWNRTFGGKDMDHAQSAVQTEDGGYLIVGETLSFGAGNYDFWVVKTDCNGSMKWNRTFGGKDMDHAQSVVQSEDGGYLIAGYSEKLFYYNFQLYKTNEEGFLQWEKNYSVNSDIFANSIIKTTDKEYMLTGFELIVNPNMDFFMLKTNISQFNSSYLYPIANAGYDETVEMEEVVNFNATGFDHDGKIIRYRWDFDGDGLFDWESNTSDLTTYFYSEIGVYNSFLEVIDDNNLKNIDMKLIIVNPTDNEIKNANIYLNFWFYFFLIIVMIFSIFLIALFYSKNLRKKISNFYIIKKVSWINQINPWFKYIIISFFLITVIKITISLLFSNPYVYSDEFIYGFMANKIYNGNILILADVPFSTISVPAGYSYLLSPAYFFKDDMDLVYHVFLFINSIITSLLILPVFFIMRKFVDEKKSFITSIMVATLPIIFAHNFTLLSENLFILLFLISCFLIIKTFSYDKFDKQFIFLAVLTGLSVGFLIMTRALGVAALGGLFCVFLLKIIKNRNFSNFKYFLVFLPFIPAFIIGYLTYGQKVFFLGYLGSIYTSNISIIFSDFSNIIRFFRLILNEVNYFIIMSYIIFASFTIFLIMYRKKLTKKRKEKLSIFLIYSICTTFFLILITVIHIFQSEYSIYSRYVFLGLPIIFMMGVIGLDLFLKLKNKNKYFQLASVTIVIFIICIVLFPVEKLKYINNLDLIWTEYLNQIHIFSYNFIQISQIILIFFLISILVIIAYFWFKKRRLILFQKMLKRINMFFLISIILSVIFFVPALNEELIADGGLKDTTDNQIARWFMKNDPSAHVILEGPYSAFSGGGIEGKKWHHMRVNMYFWLPDGNIEVLDRENLTHSIKSGNLNGDYIVSTHDLTQYYQLIKNFNMNLWVWPLKKQPFVDWHIYKIV